MLNPWLGRYLLLQPETLSGSTSSSDVAIQIPAAAESTDSTGKIDCGSDSSAGPHAFSAGSNPTGSESPPPQPGNKRRSHRCLRRREHPRPFIVTLQLSPTPLSEEELKAREARLRALSEQAVVARLNNPGHGSDVPPEQHSPPTTQLQNNTTEEIVSTDLKRSRV